MGLYEFARWLGRPLSYDFRGLEGYLGGAAVFVANHAGSTGPVQMCLSLPIRFYPWVAADMLGRRTASEYLRLDFVEPELGLRGRAGRLASWGLAQIAVWLLTGVGSIPVERRIPGSRQVFRHSLEVLQSGGALLIFPEDPTLPIDPASGMRPFMCGFGGLGEMFHKATDGLLPFYPAAVVPARRLVRVGEPRELPPGDYARPVLLKFCRQLQADVVRLGSLV